MSDFEPPVLSPGVPKGMKHEDSGHHLAFSWGPGNPLIALQGLFASICLVAFVGLSAGVLPGVFRVALGICLTVFAIRPIVNRTRVRVTPDELTVKSGPIFGRKHVFLNPLTLKQLYVRPTPDKLRHNEVPRYEVRAIVNDFSDVLVAGNLAGLDQAHWIESQIERYLELRDKPTIGSLPRRSPPEPIDQGNIINPPLIDPDQV